MFLYKITCLVNNKIYIGQTVKSIEKRWIEHVYLAMTNRAKTSVARAIRKYGVSKFKVEEIGGANSLSELNYLEWLTIINNNSLHPHGYNMKNGGKGNGKYTKSIKDKISRANGRRIWTEEMREVMSKAIKKWHKKKPQSRSPETRAKTSRSNTEYNKKNPERMRKLQVYAQEYNRLKSIPIFCVETSKTYSSIGATSRELCLDEGSIRYALDHKVKHKGYTLIKAKVDH